METYRRHSCRANGVRRYFSGWRKSSGNCLVWRSAARSKEAYSSRQPFGYVLDFHPPAERFNACVASTGSARREKRTSVGQVGFRRNGRHRPTDIAMVTRAFAEICDEFGHSPKPNSLRSKRRSQHRFDGELVCGRKGPLPYMRFQMRMRTILRCAFETPQPDFAGARRFLCFGVGSWGVSATQSSSWDCSPPLSLPSFCLISEPPALQPGL